MGYVMAWLGFKGRLCSRRLKKEGVGGGGLVVRGWLAWGRFKLGHGEGERV